MMYTVKSVSCDGVWYLVNHWNTNKRFWQQKDNITPYTTFSSKRTAKASLTKLLKVMAEYKDDWFTLVRFDWDAEHNCYNMVELERIYT